MICPGKGTPSDSTSAENALDEEIQRLNLVAPTSWVKKIDDWRRREPDLPNLSEAIRRLVELGLEAAKRKR
jgi:hypothetical protein